MERRVSPTVARLRAREALGGSASFGQRVLDSHCGREPKHDSVPRVAENSGSSSLASGNASGLRSFGVSGDRVTLPVPGSRAVFGRVCLCAARSNEKKKKSRTPGPRVDPSIGRTTKPVRGEQQIKNTITIRISFARSTSGAICTFEARVLRQTVQNQ